MKSFNGYWGKIVRSNLKDEWQIKATHFEVRPTSMTPKPMMIIYTIQLVLYVTYIS